MANESSPSKGANVWLALVAGLAVGFAVGRETGRGGAGSVENVAEPAGAPAPGGSAAGKAYASEAQFPAGWHKSTELTGVSGLSFEGLTDAQKAAVMQPLNERKCACGCPHQSIALCLKEDPNCPRSRMVKEAVTMAKQGKSPAEIAAYVDRENGGGGAAQPSAPEAPAGAKKVVVPAHAPRKGPKNPKVTIVEFSDFQCPFCSRVLPTLKEIEQKYPKDVAVAFVNQPLGFHQQAEPAARAFLAAARQSHDKAWEIHDKMFANQQALQTADLERYAKEVGLNVGRWKKDFEDPKTKEQVQQDQALANSVGATGTPTFFVNGREVVGAQPFPAFQAIIDEEIKKADALLKKGVKPEDLYAKLMEQAAAAPPPAAAAAPAAAPEKVDIDAGNAPIKGQKNAPVTIVTFSDFQCPFCSRVNPTLKQIEDTYKGKVRIAFKHLPLAFHNNAQIAAEASMAAHEQGKFWDMHDKLFANQQALDRPALDGYAKELGLDVAKFKAALDSGKYREAVQKDAAQAGTVGATGTPTFFVNGRKIVGAQPFDGFKTLIEDELAKAKK